MCCGCCRRFSWEWLDTSLIVVWVGAIAAAVSLAISQTFHLTLNVGASEWLDPRLTVNLFLFFSCGRLVANFSDHPTLAIMGCAYLMAAGVVTFSGWHLIQALPMASLLAVAYLLVTPLAALFDRIKPRARRIKRA